MVCTWKTCVDSKRVQEECLLSVFFFFFFGLCHKTCGILVPQLGIEVMLPALEAQGLNCWTAREVPEKCFQCEGIECLIT